VAELADVEQALVTLITSAAYPNGVDAVSLLGVPLRIYRGRPTNAALIADRASGTIDVGVYAIADTTRNTTRWGVQVAIVPTMPSLTVAVSGISATFFGVAAAGDLAGLLINQQAFVYQAQAGDSAALVAAALADIVRTKMICWLSAATLTAPSAFSFVARTASTVIAIQEWCRQEQGFQVSIWSPTPTLRDGVAQVVGGSLAQTSFLSLADGTGGRIRYRSTANYDTDQTSSIYRRDLNYDVEYGTTITSNAPTMLFGDLDWNGITIFA
jgi:hypothetical protein